MSCQPRPTGLIQIFTAATASANYMLDKGQWGRDVLIIHTITNGATGGHLALSVCTNSAGTVAVAHHGDATNLPATNTPTSYTAIVRDIGEFTKIALTVAASAGGTHNVWVQVLA